jgi:hypothetical protein
VISRTKEGTRARRNRTRIAIITAAAAVTAAALFAGSAQAALSVSPNLHPNGFPLWYADASGNQLGLCVDDPVLCPGEPPPTSSDLKGPDGEAFYYSAKSEPVDADGGTVVATFAVEAAFGDKTTPNLFTRVRYTFSKSAAEGDYEIKHPWGTEIVTNDGSKNQGADIGCFPVANLPCDFTAPTLGPINHWLRAANAPTDASGKLIAYGDGATPTTVTGGNVEDVVSPDGLTVTPTEVDSLTVTGPDGETHSTDLWTVMGKLFDPAAPVLDPPAVPAPRPNPKPSAPSPTVVTNTIVRTIPGPIAATQSVLGTTARSLAVSRLSVARRVGLARLRAKGLRASMRVPAGTNSLRIAVYRARNGRKTGPALFVTTRAPRAGALYRVTLRDPGLLRKLRTGAYIMEVRAGSSVTSLGTPRYISFTVTR